ncbi:acyloxyacyl hydrolase [Brumimicrobium salinarum]|nr:acyloxyacyl hydrolase [Brumimicrobium salinarum]
MGTVDVGYLMPHRSTMAHLVRQHAYGVGVQGVIQTNGEKQWHHDFNLPSIHAGISYFNLGNTEVLGNAINLTTGLYLPYLKKNGFSFGSQLSAGMSYFSKKYDLEDNPKNNAIGSHINICVDLGFKIEKQFQKHSLGFAIGMKHMSNGAYKLPNLGVNLPYLSLNYTYFLHPLRFLEEPIIGRVGQQAKSWRFYTQLVGSVKEIYPTGGNRHGVLALTNYTHYKFTPKCIVEGGVDVIYNATIVKYNGGNHGKEKNIQLGLYGAYVLPIHQIQLLVGMGRYVYNPLDPAGMWYHKFGGRFKITEKIWANVSIKSHWAKADYFEYGLIYRW